MVKIYQLVFILLLAVVLTLSLLPLDENFISTGWDKTNHLLAFVSLIAVMDIAYPKWAYWRVKVLALIVFGLLIELLQGLTDYRFFSWLDLFADTLALIIFYPLRSYYLSFVDRIERCCS
jgi:glycopeptide antibiotics resistance protein